MDDVDASAPLLKRTSQNHLLRRRNSISPPVVVPINLTAMTIDHHKSSSSNSISASTASCSSSSTSSSSTADFDYISIKPVVLYTSLRDLLPSTPVNSPKPNSPAQSGSSDISIKNRLVKQAAWAYLQPMSSSPDSSARNFFHRLWNHLQLLKNPFASLRDFFDLHIFRRINRAFDWLLRAILPQSFS